MQATSPSIKTSGKYGREMEEREREARGTGTGHIKYESRQVKLGLHPYLQGLQSGLSLSLAAMSGWSS